MRSFEKVAAAFAIGLIAVPGASAQERPIRLTFDVASVRLSEPGAATGGLDPVPGGIGYIAEATTLKTMLGVIYRIPLRQIVGGPDWIATEKFDVQAKADRPYSTDELHIMFQNLLTDRFNLKVHRERRTGAVYALTVASSGVKMTPVDAGTDRNIPITNGGNDEFIGERVRMDFFCWWLGLRLQQDERPVIDRTGLPGNYDFRLSFRPELAPGSADASASVDNRPSIFEALPQQLGLRLVPDKGPVEMLVIDHVEQPSAN